MNTIADHVSACLQEFNSLCSSPTIWTDSIPDEGTQSDISLVKLQNELSRFKIWSGNIGAHRKGRSSLDHRLRDASNIRDQVVELLEDLRESLKDAKDILTGQTTPWDQDLSPADFSDSDSDREPFQDGASGNSELSQIFAAIVEDINCLFRLSVSIHNPSPHDRFKKACLTDTSGYEPFDVQHVCNKLSKAPKSIAERLGKAISRRRQYFKYRELHHDKLTSGLEIDDKDQMQSTVASSLPKKLNVNEPVSLEENVDDASDAERSQTSWATSAANPERRKIPALPAGAENGPFECPFCFMMVSIASRNHWKKHVFSDLFPYICVELGCPAPDQDFQRRHQWADHVKKHHWKTWACKLGCDKTFDSSQDMKRHLEHKHSETAEMTHLDSLLTICEKPKSENEPADCPLCGERQSSFKQYQRHVGRHQEDLALFALPHLPGEEDGKNDESGFESEEQEELESVVEEKLEKASSYVTRLSDESGDKAPAAVEHSPRYSRLVGVATADVTDGITYGTTFTNAIAGPGYWQSGSHSWTCPIPSCLYHDHGWPTEEQRDRHYSNKHSETPAVYECMFKPCPYKSKRETNCKQHMEKAHGWTYIRPQKNDKKLPSISDVGVDTAIEQPEIHLDIHFANESLDHGRGPDTTYRHVETVIPVENTPERFNPAHFDVLYLHHKNSIYTFEFPRHDIRDGRLQVSGIRDLAVGLGIISESFRHLVELSCKDTKLLIDGTPIRNYGISSGDTIKVELLLPVRKLSYFGNSPGKDPVLDNGHGTEGNMELEGKEERDKRRTVFYEELRQRATSESSSDQVPVPKSESDLELRDNLQASAPGQPPKEVGSKVAKYPRPGVRCPMCATEDGVVWVIPGRCCGYCGTPCADEDTPEPQDLSIVTGGNDDAEARLVSVLGQKRFACTTCGETFYRADNRRRHEREVHGTRLRRTR
ncbi:Zinc finger transcription factor ace1 [Fusarium oxysporum f. sp. cubense]|uniref:Zinc finger transcription factor ace1 n=1 Tax=Fusarium oxysporum f. sp. cubense TaxID=61366 RepID=A0A559LG52_FUSOC|nr:Zinc finger transcription factor ace1 [Fusarium oxysporum f. sp. cubense]